MLPFFNVIIRYQSCLVNVLGVGFYFVFSFALLDDEDEDKLATSSFEKYGTLY